MHIFTDFRPIGRHAAAFGGLQPASTAWFISATANRRNWVCA